jgi:hypothetical protein
MKRLALLTLGLALVLTACGGDTAEDASPADSEASSQGSSNRSVRTPDPEESIFDPTVEDGLYEAPNPKPPSQPDEEYYMSLFEDGDVAPGLSEEEQLYTEYRICEYLLHDEILSPDERDAVEAAGIEREVTPVEVETIVGIKEYLIERLDTALTATDRDVIIFASAWSLCPEVQDQLTDKAKEVAPFSYYDDY